MLLVLVLSLLLLLVVAVLMVYRSTTPTCRHTASFNIIVNILQKLVQEAVTASRTYDWSGTEIARKSSAIFAIDKCFPINAMTWREGSDVAEIRRL